MVSIMVQLFVSLTNRLNNGSLSLSTMDLLTEDKSNDITANGWLEGDRCIPS